MRCHAARLGGLAASYAPPGREVIFRSETGILGMGPKSEPGQEDPYMIDAGKNKTTLFAGGGGADRFLCRNAGTHALPKRCRPWQALSCRFYA